MIPTQRGALAARTEALEVAGLAVGREAHLLDRAALAEERSDVLLLHRPGEVAQEARAAARLMGTKHQHGSGQLQLGATADATARQRGAGGRGMGRRCGAACRGCLTGFSLGPSFHLGDPPAWPGFSSAMFIVSVRPM